MKILISNSAKHLGTLYHGTSKTALNSILRSGELRLSVGRLAHIEDIHARDRLFFVSFTRSRMSKYLLEPEIKVIIELDGDALSSKYKIVPVDYHADLKNKVRLLDSDRRSEAEERLISDLPAIPIIPYIKHIYFISEGNSYNRSNDQQLYKDSKINEGMAPILTQLKLKKIPYSFYSSVEGWRSKRGEFSALFTPKPFIKRHTATVNKKAYMNFLSLLHTLQGIATTEERKVTGKFINGMGTAEAMRDILLHQNENTSLKPVAIKLSRVFKRLGIVSPRQLTDYVRNLVDANSGL